MDPFIKHRTSVFLAVGKRTEALELIRESYKVSDEEAEKLLSVLEVELATESKLKFPGIATIVKWVGTALTLVGIVIMAIAIAMYTDYINAKTDFHKTQCTVASIVDSPNEGLSITFSYTYGGQSYSTTQTSSKVRQLNLHEGDVLDLLVDPEKPENTWLPIAEDLITSSAMNLGGIGLGMILMAVAMWVYVNRMGIVKS